jgi:peptide/nickel transport system permease protein
LLAGALRALARNRTALLAVVLLLIISLASVFAGVLTPHDPLAIDLAQALQPPSATHLLGTDNLGRDVLARLLYGGRVSLTIGIVSTLAALVVGVSGGLIAGYYGRRVEIPLLAASDLLLAFPTLLFAIFLVATVGASLMTLIVAIAIREVPVYLRLVRSYVLSLKQLEFIVASRAVGCGDLRILVRHLLPNTVGVVTVQSTFFVARAIITAASLGFLGLGVPQPTPEWGVMLAEARQYLPIAPQLMMLPGLMLIVVVLALNLLGDVVRDYLDPQARHRV